MFERPRFLFENSLVVASGAASALFVVCARTAPQTVALEDGGLFVMAALDAGVAHSPGYPLFILLGHLFSCLWLGTSAWWLHLLSAPFGALACGILYVIGRRLSVPAWAAPRAPGRLGLRGGQLLPHDRAGFRLPGRYIPDDQ